MKEIIEDATAHLIEYVLDTERDTGVRAEICGCGNCIAQHDDADDRLNWLLERDVWTMVCIGRKDGRKIVFDNSDWYRDLEDKET